MIVILDKIKEEAPKQPMSLYGSLEELMDKLETVCEPLGYSRIKAVRDKIKEFK